MTKLTYDVNFDVVSDQHSGLQPMTKLTYDVNFDVVSDKLTPILGCRTIQEMGLIQLNTGTYDSISSVSSVQPQLKSQTDYYKEFPEVFNKDVGTLEGRVSLQINKDVTPTALPARQIPVALRQPVREELRRLQALDVITPVTSPTDWVSQLVTVHKSDGTVRLCIDPKPLNEALRRDR